MTLATPKVLARAQADLAAILAAAGPVPVLVVPPVANERDLAPLGSVDAGPEVEALVKRAVEDPLPARAEVEAALAAHPDHAGLHHVLGLAGLATAAGEPVSDAAPPDVTRAPPAALAALRGAIDLDTLPVRPRSDLRAALAASPWVCDPEPALRAATPDGVLGWPVLVDHVHLGLPGGMVLADAVAACLAARADLPFAAVASSGGEWLPTPTPFSPVDEAVGLRAVGRYVATSALAASPSAPVLLRRLAAAIDALDGLLTPVERREVAAPPTEDIHVRLARDPARTLPELERAARTHAGDPTILRALAAARRAAGDEAGAHRAEAEAVLWASLAP